MEPFVTPGRLGILAPAIWRTIFRSRDGPFQLGRDSHIDRMLKRKKKSAFPDREIIAKAEGRFAKADKQRASIRADPKKAVEREQDRVQRVKSVKTPTRRRSDR